MGKLHGVELEPSAGRHFEHVQVNVRVLVAGEADVAELAGPLRFEERLHRAAFGEDTVGVLVADDLVMLE